MESLKTLKEAEHSSYFVTHKHKSVKYYLNNQASKQNFPTKFITFSEFRPTVFEETYRLIEVQFKPYGHQQESGAATQQVK